ncbi:MAG: CDP-alcohol phosphatidyltransferase family protein [Pseudomonadota bacterium]
MSGYQRWRRRAEKWFLSIVAVACNAMAAGGLTPNAVTVSGFLLSAAAGACYARGWLLAAGLVVLFAGVCDAADGMLARRTGRESRFGAFLDSSLDRLGEICLFCGLMWHFAPISRAAALMCMLALTGSLMVSYTRARAEGLGVTCRVGWMQRPERMALLIAGSLAGALPAVGDVLMSGVLTALAVASYFSMIQRIVHVFSSLRGDARSSGRNSGSP